MDFAHADVDQVDGNGRTPLHLEAALGNTEFALFLLRLRPQLAIKVDYKGIAPLHLASANGHVEVLRHLLNANPSTCLLQDNEGNTPLHVAAKTGQIEVVRHLLEVNQNIILLEDLKGNTPLHVAASSGQIRVAKLLISRLQQQPEQCEIKHTQKLQKCVIRCRSEALQQIIEADPNFLNGCDEDRNTLLHTATLLRDPQMVNFLVHRDVMLIAKNKNGFTALDIIERSSKKDDRYKEIWTLLKRHADKWEPMTGKFFENKRNAILVTASIITSMAFTAGLNPPGGFWQEDDEQTPGTSVMASTNPFMYSVFLGNTTLAFVLSMCIILLLISEIRSSRKIFMHLLTVGMWFAITLIGCTYFQALQVIIPPTVNENTVILMSIISMFVWVVLTGIILLDRANLSTCFLTKNRDLTDRATNQHNADQNDGGDQNNSSVDVGNYNDDEVPAIGHA